MVQQIKQLQANEQQMKADINNMIAQFKQDQANSLAKMKEMHANLLSLDTQCQMLTKGNNSDAYSRKSRPLGIGAAEGICASEDDSSGVGEAE